MLEATSGFPIISIVIVHILRVCHNYTFIFSINILSILFTLLKFILTITQKFMPDISGSMLVKKSRQ
ncbi:unnamed protein product [Meloidogyne enterolobii]|uniref:Uncharacterized protein n=2 Tax=Meloidogyne enterolobii TaxID=390850 RepID=A0A6V7Y2R3_MELEN|nr:unnamed protein product [Meloidogyne enterolobii]